MIAQMTHGPEADAAYIRLSDLSPLESEEASPGIVLDFTSDGQVVGIEVLFASRTLAPGEWSKAPLPRPALAHTAE